MTVTHLGHACVLYATGSDRVLIDPGNMSSFAGLTDLTAVLVTHEHGDHVDVAGVVSLLEVNPSATLVTDERTAGQFADVTVARPGDVLTLGGVTVSVLGGTHAPVYGDVPDCPNLAYLLDDGALLHPGDSFFVPAQSQVQHACRSHRRPLAQALRGDRLRPKAVVRRTVLPIHEGELTDQPKYVGMLNAFR